jgi:hypothetical protein
MSLSINSFTSACCAGVRHRLSGNAVFLIDCTYKTNTKKMPLMHVMALTPMNMGYTFCVAFLSGEEESHNSWAVNQMKKLIPYHDDLVFVTGRELSLMHAIDHIFPSAKSLLCIWHIYENVKSHAKTSINGSIAQDNFCELFQCLVNSKTEDEYEINYNALKDMTGELDFNYLHTKSAL